MLEGLSRQDSVYLRARLGTMGTYIRNKLSKKEMETTAEELRHGQIVIVTARWALVLAGLVLLMWRPVDLAAFTIGILVVLALAVVNFFLHVQILRDRPIARTSVYGMSLADLLVITLIVITREGFNAHTFVFYYPAVLAYSLVFPGRISLLLTAGLMAVYGLISMPEVMNVELNQQILVTRLLMIAAVSYLGYRYRLVERRRLEALRSSSLKPPRAQPIGCEAKGG